jgi:dienelactone hydrolase
VDETPKPDQPKTLNTLRTFPEVQSKAEWQQRAKEIREQVLVSAGLWPMPERTPLRTHIFGKVERDGYSVEKVHLQTRPGFYLGGNLYRPLGKGKGPFPGILNPHGHWGNGRMADTKDGSIAARCISFARQGMVAFSYDMVGYNDTFFPDHGEVPADKFYVRHRRFATNEVNQLWNISQMGLQTWNSIRALDFLESLPDVDKKRLACTGESGGGTQTFMLGAIEDRLAVQAPIVMVSHSMQGGCSCENMPGLRVEYSNMEIAAAAATRPQILVAASGDWTKDTPTVEGPAIEKIYRLLGAPDNLRYVRFDFGHNYNQTSREAVYEWFGKWLLRHPNPASLKEAPYTKEPDADLRVFSESKLPDDAVTEAHFIEALKRERQQAWQSLGPKNKRGFEKFKQVIEPAWRHTLQVSWPKIQTQVSMPSISRGGAVMTSEAVINRLGESQKISAVYFAPRKISEQTAPKIVILADASDQTDFLNKDGSPASLAKRVLDNGHAALVVKRFSTPEPANQFANFFSTYNRTKAQERVRDLLTLCSVARTIEPEKARSCQVVLVGAGRVGLWSLLAAPGADAVVADCARIDTSDDETLLSSDLFVPGLRAIGSFEGPLILAAPHPLLVHNVGTHFQTESIRSSYKALGAGKKLRQESSRLSEDEIVKWISQL